MKKGFFERLGNSTYKRAIYLNHALSAAFNPCKGVCAQRRSPELIVSLTTIPERIGRIHIVLDCLLRQSLKPDRVILWLNECDEPGRPLIRRDNLPSSLTRLMGRGLSIEWCRNIGPYCKLVPALRMFPEAVIATADDDVYYGRDWLKSMYEAYLREPAFIHCHRAHRMKFDASGELLPYRKWDYFAPGVQGPDPLLFPTGVGGILYAPGHLHPDATNEGLFLEYCPKADDIWFRAMAAASGTLCKKVALESSVLHSIRYRNNRKLMSSNVTNDGNDLQIREVARHCPAFAEIIASGKGKAS